jgi:hypothetical protein
LVAAAAADAFILSFAAAFNFEFFLSDVLKPFAVGRFTVFLPELTFDRSLGFAFREPLDLLGAFPRLPLLPFFRTTPHTPLEINSSDEGY